MKLRGIIPPVITPLTKRGTLDQSGFRILLNRLIEGGVHGLFLLGTTGEGPALGIRLQKEVIQTAMSIVGNRLPVLAGISAAALDDSLEIADHACRNGVAALVCAPPCYFRPGEAEIVDYYKAVCSGVRLPLYLYNMPAMTKVSLPPALILRLAELPRVTGYKDSSGNMAEFHEVLLALKERDDFSIFVGPEELLAESVLFGADGGVPGGANLNPRLFVRIYEAARAENIPELRELQKEVYRQRRLYRIGQDQSSLIKGLKCALAEQNVCGDSMTPPFQAFHRKERNEIRNLLRDLHLPE